MDNLDIKKETTEVENKIEKLFKWIDLDSSSEYSKLELKTIAENYRGVFAKNTIYVSLYLIL
jgi:hypothetical protein